jgi:hypothetical protein
MPACNTHQLYLHLHRPLHQELQNREEPSASHLDDAPDGAGLVISAFVVRHKPQERPISRQTQDYGTCYARIIKVSVPSGIAGSNLPATWTHVSDENNPTPIQLMAFRSSKTWS